MPHRILNEDWSDYNKRKIRDRREEQFFSCDEVWEVKFLLRLIHKHLPDRLHSEILEAISECCLSVPGKKPRKEFVECVMGKL